MVVSVQRSRLAVQIIPRPDECCQMDANYLLNLRLNPASSAGRCAVISSREVGRGGNLVDSLLLGCGGDKRKMTGRFCLFILSGAQFTCSATPNRNAVCGSPWLYSRNPAHHRAFLLGLSAAQRKFAHSLRDFKFEFIGDAETDDERCIGKEGGRSDLPSSVTSDTNSCLSPFRCFLTGIFQLSEESGRTERDHGECQGCTCID